MYWTHGSKKKDNFKITEEDVLQLLYVRCGRSNLDSEIAAIFGPEEKSMS
jgi:hypothetical protein